MGRHDEQQGFGFNRVGIKPSQAHVYACSSDSYREHSSQSLNTQKEVVIDMIATTNQDFAPMHPRWDFAMLFFHQNDIPKPSIDRTHHLKCCSMLIALLAGPACPSPTSRTPPLFRQPIS